MPALIPAIVAALMTVLRVLLIAKIGSFIVSALVFFGLTIGINNYAIEPALNALQTYVGQLGASGGAVATALAWAGVLNFDKAIGVLISAYTTAWTIRGAKVFLMRSV